MAVCITKMHLINGTYTIFLIHQRIGVLLVVIQELLVVVLYYPLSKGVLLTAIIYLGKHLTGTTLAPDNGLTCSRERVRSSPRGQLAQLERWFPLSIRRRC